MFGLQQPDDEMKDEQHHHQPNDLETEFDELNKLICSNNTNNSNEQQTTTPKTTSTIATPEPTNRLSSASN